MEAFDICVWICICICVDLIFLYFMSSLAIPAWDGTLWYNLTWGVLCLVLPLAVAGSESPPCGPEDHLSGMYVRIILDFCFFLGCTIFTIMVFICFFFTCRYCCCKSYLKRRRAAPKFAGISAHPAFSAAITMSFANSAAALRGMIEAEDSKEKQPAVECSTCALIRSGDYLVSTPQCPQCGAYLR